MLTDKLTNFDEVLLKAYRISLCVIRFKMLCMRHVCASKTLRSNVILNGID